MTAADALKRHRADILRIAAQQQALAFVQQLENVSELTISGEALGRFVGTIADDDLALISAAVEADCERIDAAGW